MRQAEGGGGGRGGGGGGGWGGKESEVEGEWWPQLELTGVLSSCYHVQPIYWEANKVKSLSSFD